MMAIRNQLEDQVKRLRAEEAEMMVRKENEIQESGDALKQTMLHKIQQKKIELFSQQKINYAEDIELVMQQNRHYESQLEYQTKHLEHVLIKNEKLRMLYQSHKNEMSIHRNIQEELVKRIYYSKQIAEEFETKNRTLQEDINIAKRKLREVTRKVAELSVSEFEPSHEMAVKLSETKEQLRQKKNLLASQNAQNQTVLQRFVLFYNTLIFLEQLILHERDRTLSETKGKATHPLKAFKRSFGPGPTGTAQYNQFLKNM